MKSEHPARRAARSLRCDVAWSGQAFVRNTLAGSPLIPRPLRAAIYRLAGYRFETVNISAGAIFNNGSVTIGRETAIARACCFEGRAPISIGDTA